MQSNTRHILSLIVCSMLFMSSFAHAEDIKNILTKLENEMAEIHSIQTHFVQEKRLGLLDNTLTLKGTIYIEKPMAFAWYVTEPIKYSLVIKDGVMLQWDEDTNKTHSMSLKKNPVLGMVFSQMEGWVSGAYVSMLDEYAITVLDTDLLTLQCMPLDASMAYGLIEKVIITFKTDTQYIDRIEIQEKSGDSTTLVFVETVLNSTIDAQVWEIMPSV